MKYRHPNEASPDYIRASALASAVVLRDCSLRADLSYPTRRACRTLMRAQAGKWRHPPPAGEGTPTAC
jgi:hypothetical protein